MLWDTIANKVLVLRGHQNMVFVAVFSPDGRTIVTASEDQTARLWDVATGKEIATLRGHQRKVGWATFSPDGRSVVTNVPGRDCEVVGQCHRHRDRHPARS